MKFYVSPFAPNTARRMALRNFEQNAAHSLPVDIQDDGETYTLTAYAPSAQAETINIQVLDDVVSVEGEFAVREGEYLLRETPAGAFRRVLRLPAALDAEKVEATLEHGVLIVRLPKAESAKPRTIKVNYN